MACSVQCQCKRWQRVSAAFEQRWLRARDKIGCKTVQLNRRCTSAPVMHVWVACLPSVLRAASPQSTSTNASNSHAARHQNYVIAQVFANRRGRARFASNKGHRQGRSRGYLHSAHIQARDASEARSKPMRATIEGCCEQPPHEQWVPLFKIQVFFSCVSFSIIVPSLANYLRRMGADEWVLGVAVAVYSLGEMVGSAVFGKLMTKRLREAPATGPRRCLLETMVFGVVGSILYVVADDVGQSPNLRAWAPWVVVCEEIKILRHAHAIDATPARWRGDASLISTQRPTG